MEISSVNFIHLFRPNQQQLRKTRLSIGLDSCQMTYSCIFHSCTLLELNKYIQFTLEIFPSVHLQDHSTLVQ
jgi:hypothetical protein